MVEKPEDGSIKETIIGLLKKGYTRKQLITDFSFAERTVDAAIRAYRELNDDNVEGTKEGSKPIADNGASPAAKPKNSDKGATGSPRDGVLAIRKEKESVLP